MVDEKTTTEAEAEEALLAKVNAVIQPLGCVATDIGPKTVGVQGDGRVYVPLVFVTFPPEMQMDEIGNISTKIINEVPGISRVMANIAGH